MKTIDLQSAKRVFVALLVTALLACSWLSPLEPAANRYVDAGLKRALISFASARALNAVISVAQGTEVAVQPAGVGVIFSPGQVLDPVNDLIEQFANLMLTASVAFGVQKVLLGIGAHWLVSLLLTLSALGWAAFALRRQRSPAWLSCLLLIFLMIRFALPVAVIGSDVLFRQFMEADYRASQQGIDSVSGQLDKLDAAPAAATAEPGLLGKFRGWATPDFKTRYDQLKQAAEQATERIVMLMAIFLLQTLVLPVGLLWILWALVRRIVEFSPPFDRRPSRR